MIIKKILIYIIGFILILNTTFFINIQRASANGFVVSGANALKGAVISSMESAGVKFANKEAKERAFDAWNMKAYEKWQKDEAAGKNAALWAHFNGETAKIANSHVNVLPDKPGFGNLLLNSTWFGMAISIGAEVGFAIEDAQAQARYEDGLLTYLSTDVKTFEGISYNDYLNVTVVPQSRQRENGTTIYFKTYLVGPYPIANMVNPYEDTSYATISNFTVKGNHLELTVHTFNDFDDLKRNDRQYQTTVWTEGVLNPIAGGIPYQFKPPAGDRPAIAPNPYVEPLITPKPDIGSVPAIMPSPDPVPVVIPIGDPFGDNPHIKPYTPPGVDPGTDPGKEPGTDPGKDPGTDPGTDPGKDPGTDPGTDPGKDPGKEPGTEPGGGDPKDPDDETPDKDKNKQELENESKKLGQLVTTRFPFSLPWDFVALVKLLYAEPMTPRWEITGTDKIPLNFEINLEFLDPYIGWFRGFVLIGFIAQVIFMHSRFMGGSK